MIDRLETAYYRFPFQFMSDPGRGTAEMEELLLVKVHAYGFVGHGYAYTLGQGGRAIQSLVEHDLAAMLQGQDLLQVQALWELMRKRSQFIGRGGLMSFAIAAVDIALWDLLGLVESKPLYQLLGGSPRPIPVYGSSSDLDKPVEELLQRVSGFLEQGLPGVEVKVGHPEMNLNEKRVAEVRRLIGGKIDLMVDANMAFSGYQALMQCQRLQPFRPRWIEEPTLAEDVASHARLARALETPIAAGECLHGLHEFRRLIEEEGINVLQIDPVCNGGITASLKALALADQAGLETSCHYADTVGVHLLSASQNAVYMEKHLFSLDAFLENPQPVLNGRARPVNTPGTGLRFNEKALEPYRA